LRLGLRQENLPNRSRESLCYAPFDPVEQWYAICYTQPGADKRSGSRACVVSRRKPSGEIHSGPLGAL
jgi:hypothetical protein